MPKYAYKCKSCSHEFEIRHSIKDKLVHCVTCDEGTLQRIPSVVTNVKIKEKQQTGKIVDKFIEEARQEVEGYKKELGNKVHKS